MHASTTTSSLIDAAAVFAVAAHESHEQLRKFTGEPYYTHPMAVAAIVASVTDDAALIAASWLHDVLEDTSVPARTLEERFGVEVTALVLEVTNIGSPGHGNRAARSLMNRIHLAAASPRAKTLKLADILHNVSSVLEGDRKFARRYIAEKRQVLPLLREGHPVLYARLEAVLAELARNLELS